MAGKYLYSNGSKDQEYPQHCCGDYCSNLVIKGIWRFEFFERNEFVE